jgi:uncharacterized protein (TIGR02271 family)
MSDRAETVSIPVIEEELRLSRETVETGRVRVRTVAEERTENISEPLLQTDVIIERVPKDVELNEMPAIRDEGDSIVVPVVEERFVKKLFLIEELRLTRRASTRDIDQQIKLRSQQVVVEREESSGDPSAKE